MGGSHAAAVDRHPVLALEGRAYHDRLLVLDFGCATNVGGFFGEEVAPEPGTDVEARLYAMP
jgi:hypothetical protein